MKDEKKFGTDEGLKFWEDTKYDEILFVLQFIFGWLSLLLFTLEYLSAEQEVRKVLGMEFTHKKRRKFGTIAILLLLLTPLVTFLLFRLSRQEMYKYHVSELAAVLASGSLFALYVVFVRDISILINESGLDILPVKKTFCKSISVIGLIFFIQIAEVFVIFLEFITVDEFHESGDE